QLVPPDTLTAPLANLEETIRATEERARRAFAQQTDVRVRQPQSSHQAPPRPTPASVQWPNAGKPKEALPLAQPIAPRARSATPARIPVVQSSSGVANSVHPAPQSHEQAHGQAAVRKADEAKLMDAHVVLMELTVQIAFLVARCDGRIARKERAVIEEHLRRRFGYDPALYNRARALAVHFESAAIDIEECLQRTVDTFTPEHRSALLEFAYQIAEASRGVSKRETALLEQIARRLRVGSFRRPIPQPGPAPASDAGPSAPSIAQKPLL